MEDPHTTSLYINDNSNSDKNKNNGYNIINKKTFHKHFLKDSNHKF